MVDLFHLFGAESGPYRYSLLKEKEKAKSEIEDEFRHPNSAHAVRLGGVYRLGLCAARDSVSVLHSSGREDRRGGCPCSRSGDDPPRGSIGNTSQAVDLAVQERGATGCSAFSLRDICGVVAR
jgi:hypothetical protein